MNASELSAALGNAATLSTSDLFYVHIDERQCSVTLGFAIQRENEATEFFLKFMETRHLKVRGWSAPGVKDVRLEDGPQGITVAITSDGSALRFEAAHMSLEKPRTFRTGSTP